jgi:hypothetical protein
MENLSTLEAALLLHIQCHPGKTLSDYTSEMGEKYIQLIHASNTLKQQNLVVVDADNKFTINEDHAREENAAISKEFAPVNPIVHTLNNDIPPKDMTLKPDMNKPSEESVLQLLIDANGRPKTALELGAFFGKKGSALTWILRNLIDQKKAIKVGTTYAMYTPDSEVKHTVPPVETRRMLTSETEIRAVIQNMKDAFTAETCHAEISRAFIVEKNYFLEVFGDLSMDGYFNVKQDGEYVDPTLDFDANNLHSVRRIMNADAVGAILEEYCRVVPPPYDLHAIIETTRLPHDMVLDYFSHRGYSMGNVRAIIKQAVDKFVAETAKPAYKMHKTHGLNYDTLQTFAGPPGFINEETGVNINDERTLQVAGIKVVEDKNLKPNEIQVKPVGKNPVKKVYKDFSTLEIADVTDYIEGGVRLQVFMKRFELDPAKTDEVKESLLLAGIAEFVQVTGFLFPKRKPVTVAVEPEPVAETPAPVAETPAPVEEIVERKGLLKNFKGGFNVEAREVSQSPTHIEDKTSPHYGKKIVSVSAGGQVQLSYLPDAEWVAAQIAAEMMKSPAVIEVPVKEGEEIADGVPVKIIDDFAVNVNLQAPTGQPPRAWSDTEKESLVSAFKTVHEVEDSHEVFDIQGKSIGVRGPVGPGPCPTGETEEQRIARQQREDEAELDECVAAIEPHMERLCHSLKSPGVSIGEPPPREFYNERKDANSVNAENANPPSLEWLLTLEMLEQRLTFEHQTRAATNLRDIRKYLEAL